MPTTLTVFHSNLVPLTELISTDCALLLAASHLTNWEELCSLFEIARKRAGCWRRRCANNALLEHPVRGTC
jgi:hypothetical protein